MSCALCDLTMITRVLLDGPFALHWTQSGHNMPAISRSEAANKTPLAHELLTQKAAPPDDTDASQAKSSHKQNWKDFLKGLVTGCGVAGV